VLEGLKQLIDLQGLDDELAAGENEHAALPTRRAELAASREAAELRVAEAQTAQADAEGEQRRAESELQDREALLQKLEGQQFQVKTNEAYTVLLREIEQAKDAISGCETRILEAMDLIESARRAHESARNERRQLLEGLAAEEKALDAREKELDARLSELQQARSRLCQSIEPELLEQYDKIAARHRPAVARVLRETCLGCRVGLPPQLRIELLRGERLITCTHCQRILIPEGAAGPAGK